MTEHDVADWLREKALTLLAGNVNMGAMEDALTRVSTESRRIALERMVRDSVKDHPLNCPVCGQALNVVSYNRWRNPVTSFGRISFARSYGTCTKCADHFYPADATLGLQRRAPSSPRIQEICALTTLRAPAGQAEEDVYRLTGVSIDSSSLHREARRQGERALRLREADERLAQTPEGVQELAARAPQSPKYSTLVIEIDAWNIRERDNWGETEALVKEGKDTGRWHWVYTATLFRLDQRGSTEAGRPVITQRGYVATRKGIDSFQHQIYAEALQRGLMNAETVLVLADGAVWIWNLIADRFPRARQRVDLYHVKEHLWNLAHELHRNDPQGAALWVRPYLQWLDTRKEGALDVIRTLGELRENSEVFSRRERKAIAREEEYFKEHKDRMDYKTGKALGQPVGSGAVESTCCQYQRRFKITGQFWSLAGDEAFLALSTLHRNGRWSRIFPHDTCRSPAGRK